MNKLGLQIQTFVRGDAPKQMVRATWPSTLKVLEDGIDLQFIAEWRTHRPDGILVFRNVFSEGPLSDMDHRLDVTLDKAELLRPHGPLYVEVPFNEEHQNGGALDELAAATIPAIDRISAAGFIPVIGIFSEGNPSNFDDWPRFFPALRHGRDKGAVLGIHEYSAPPLSPIDGFHALRYRKVWPNLPDDCKLPILVTECGLDGGVNTGMVPQRPGTGYRGYENMDPARYRDWLSTYSNAIAEDDYVWGAHVFLCGGNDQFESFDIGDEVDIRAAFTEDVPGPPRRQFPTTPEEGDMPEFILGFKQLADRLGPAVVGEPVEDEGQLGPRYNAQMTTKGIMIYSKDGNLAQFFASIEHGG